MPSFRAFHPGELAAQRKAGTRGVADELAPGLSTSLPPGGKIAPLLSTLRFINIASLSTNPGTNTHDVWVSPIFGKQFVTSPSPQHLVIDLRALPKHDILFENLSCSAQNPVGLLVLDLLARRRWRVNGIVQRSSLNEHSLELDVNVGESFPNCPKYIQTRAVTRETSDMPPLPSHTAVETARSLSSHDKDLIRASDTLFFGTYFKSTGVDVNHRGGRAGFVRVVSDNELFWPDYRGNGMFQSFGNLEVNDRAGLAFIDFGTGEVLQLTGIARVEWNIDKSLDVEAAAMRLVRFKVDGVRRSVGPATNYRWGEVDYSPYNPLLPHESEEESLEGQDFPMEVPLVKITEESSVVKTFRFLSQKRILFLPGQYATFDFGAVPELGRASEPIVRTWTLSEAANSTDGDVTLEVSVKRKKEGFISNWLHDHAKVGMRVKLLGIDGDMTPFGKHELPSRFLFISGGIGITPNMAVLRGLGSWLDAGKDEQPDVVFVHQDRCEEQIPFRNELRRRAARSNGRIKLIMVLSRGHEKSSSEREGNAGGFYKSLSGRVSTDILKEHVSDIASRMVYLCGPVMFMDSLSEALISLGVPANRIITEQFNF